MPVESPESLERIATEIALAEQRDVPVNRALRWFQEPVRFMVSFIIFLIPTILYYPLGSIFSMVKRSSWFARLQIDEDWLSPGFFLTLVISTFLLGFVHSRVYDALHPENTPKRNGALWWHATQFLFLQLLLAPLVITFLGLILYFHS